MFTPRQILQRQLMVYPAFAAIVVVALWAIVAIHAFAGWDPLKLDSLGAGVGYALIALVGTIAAPIALFRSVRRTQILLQRGVVGQAIVAKVGGVQHQGNRSVTYAYAVGGKQYTLVDTVSDDILHQYDDATRVPIIYDPTEPFVAQAFPSHVGHIEEPTAGASLAGIVEEKVWWVIGLVQLVGALVLAQWLAPEHMKAIALPVISGAIALLIAEWLIFDKLMDRESMPYRASRRSQVIALAVTAGIAIVGIPWGLQSAAEEIHQEQAQQEDSARERAERGAIERQSADALKQIERLRAARQNPSTQPASKPVSRP